MAHTVIGYPSLEESQKIVDDFIKYKVEILELQIPFSHPTADGSVLTQANRIACRETSTQAALDFMKGIKDKHPEQTIMAMTYLNKVVAYGLNEFCDYLTKINAPYLIVPDLPFDSFVAQKIQKETSVNLVPVLSANISDKRLEKALENKPAYIYLMADFKITGSAFSINERIADLIQKIRVKCPNAKIGLGFGISNSEQVKIALELADFAIIGSAFARAVNEGNLEGLLQELSVGFLASSE